MIPLAVDPRFANLAVAGNGELALRRLRALRVGGAPEVLLFADAPLPALLAEAGAYHRATMPNDADLADLHVLWIVDLADDVAQALALRARNLRLLVNIEDRPEFCDFHSVAEIRRGDLLLTVSTNGAAPGLASAIRRNLEACFPAVWAERVRQAAALRAGWREDGLGMAESAARLDNLAQTSGWLNCPARAATPQ